MIRVLSLAVAVLLPLPAAAASASKCRLETSPQCSRGSVSTSRAGPAWCERYDGQVVQLGAGLACVTPEGLEAGAAATVVTMAGDRLDTWAAGNATVTRAPGGYWRIADESTSAQGIVFQTVTDGSIGQDHTFSCLARAGTTDRATLLIGGTSHTCQVTLPRDGRFRRVSCTHTLASTVRTPALLVGWDASETGTIEVHGCQLEASAAPGRICYSGTCLADSHTLSASDWPRGNGRISVRVAGAVQPGAAQTVWASGDSDAVIAAGRLITTGLGGQSVQSEALDWSGSYRLTWEVGDGALVVKRDGTVIASGAFDGFPMQSTVTLGGGGLALKGLETVREADETIACVPVAGVGLRCTDGRASTTVRAGTATCLDGTVATENVPCVAFGSLEAFASGKGGRTAGDVHRISTSGWPTENGEVSIRFRFAESCPSGTTCYVASDGGGGTFRVWVASATGQLTVDGIGAAGTFALGAPPPVGVDETIAFRMSGGTMEVSRNGTVVLTRASTGFPAWSGALVLGAFKDTSLSQLNGFISRLSWSPR